MVDELPGAQDEPEAGVGFLWDTDIMLLCQLLGKLRFLVDTYPIRRDGVYWYDPSKSHQLNGGKRVVVQVRAMYSGHFEAGSSLSVAKIVLFR